MGTKEEASTLKLVSICFREVTFTVVEVKKIPFSVGHGCTL